MEVIKDGMQIANVSAPGSVFGEQAVLLDQPHTADVRTLEQSEFYVADAPAILAGDPSVALYVAAILARRLEAANRSLIEVKRQLQAGEPPSVIGRTVEKTEELLSYSGDASLVYAGYPYFGPTNRCTEALGRGAVTASKADKNVDGAPSLTRMLHNSCQAACIAVFTLAGV